MDKCNLSKVSRLLFFVSLTSIFLSATAVGADPNCGTVPCIAVLGDSTVNCGTDGIPPALWLYNHAPRAATVTLKISGAGAPYNQDYPVAARDKLFLGCSGSVSHAQHISYSVQHVVWH